MADTDVEMLRTVNATGLRRVIEALERLEDKRLDAAMLWNKKDNCGCLLGAIYPKSPEMKAYSLVRIKRSGGSAWVDEEREALEAWGKEMSLSPADAAHLQSFNDSTYMTLEARYAYILEALKKAVSDDE